VSDRRCCCGKVQVDPDCVATVLNDYQHDLLGPPGNFCGPRWKHEVRDAQVEVDQLKAKLVLEGRRGDDHLGAYHMEHTLAEGLKIRLTELERMTKTLLEQATAWEGNAVAWKGKTSKSASEVYAELAATLRWIIEHKGGP
jgi:hypothetical protein